MTAIADHAFAAVFTAAEKHNPVPRGGVGNRSEAGALVAAVAIGLCLAQAAGAPVDRIAFFDG